MNNHTSLPIDPLMIVFLLLFIRSLILSLMLYIRMKAAKHSPTQGNAWRVYKVLRKFGVAIRNHPTVWKNYRDMFYKINQSPDVPSGLKQKIKERLVKKGLFINNPSIIDNYRK